MAREKIVLKMSDLKAMRALFAFGEYSVWEIVFLLTVRHLCALCAVCHLVDKELVYVFYLQKIMAILHCEKVLATISRWCLELPFLNHDNVESLDKATIT